MKTLPVPRIFAAIFLSAFFTFFISLSTYAQQPEWRYYSQPGLYTSIVEEGDLLWIASWNAGLIRYNKKTSEVAHFNMANSDLPGNYIRDLAIDSKGVKWMTVEGNVIRFDDQTWTIFHKDNSEMFYTSSIELDVDGDDNIWLTSSGTGSGILKFNGIHWTWFNESNSGIKCSSTSDLHIDAHNNVWFYSCSNLVRYDGQNWYHYSEDVYPFLGVLSGVSTASDGTVWILHSSSVSRFTGTGFEVFNITNTPELYSFMNSIAIDQQDRLWMTNISYLGHGGDGSVTLFDEKVLEVFNYTNSSIKDSELGTCLIDKENKVWVTGKSGGLFEYDGKNWREHHLYSTEIQLTNVSVADIAIDHKGRWAIGTYGFSNRSCSTTDLSVYTANLRTPISEYSYKTLMLGSDSLGNLWTLEEYNLHKINDNGTDTISLPGPSYDNVQFRGELATDNKGGAWIKVIAEIKYSNTYPWGEDTLFPALAHYNGVDWDVYRIDNLGLGELNVGPMKVDAEGNLWAAASEGLLTFDGVNWSLINYPAPAIPKTFEEEVMTLAIDKKDHVWMGKGFDLLEYNGGGWIYHENHRNQPNLYHLWTDLEADSKGNIWGIDQFSQLFRFDQEGWVDFYYGEAPVPVLSNKYELAIDLNDNILIGGQFGLVVYNENGVKLPVSPLTFVEVKEGELLIYPNPTSSQTTISYATSTDGDTRISMWDLRGQMLRIVQDGFQSAGEYSIQFNTAALPQGTYVVRMETSEETASEKLVITR